MAHVTGTATNLFDAAKQIHLAMTTNSTLAALSPAQTWTSLRFTEANIDSVASNMSFAGGPYFEILTTSDARISSAMATDHADVNIYSNNCVAGTSYYRMKFLVAKAVTKLFMKATSSGARAPRAFNLQYSDDGSTWTTAASISTPSAWANYEEQEFTGWGATGSHLWWQIVITTTGGGTLFGIKSLLLYSGADVVNSSETVSILKGPGLGALDEIFIAFVTRRCISTLEYFISVHGLTGYDPSEKSVIEQPGAIPYGQPFIALWDAPMPYWFTISGRRIVGVFKVSTVYSAFYAGFFLPYATPNQYPYPMAIGGSLCSDTFLDTSHQYSRTTSRHSAFPMPASIAGSYSLNMSSTLSVCTPGGGWVAMCNRLNSANANLINPRLGNYVWPHSAWSGSTMASPEKPMAENIGGGYSLLPQMLIQSSPTAINFGELDGTKQISGDNNSSENTGTVSGIPYVVFQNVFRTGRTEFWALQGN